ncbi:MAG TPA: YggS family pyridoxal phosphate-dependent enzyme [bacterium]|nr:YggS family pyridoxal phosphate-dependent enzyme [bacterium]
MIGGKARQGANTPVVSDVAANVSRVREGIAAAARRGGRRGEDVLLVAVSKGVAPTQVQAAATSGVTDFGENRVQEALPKITQFAPQVAEAVRWHLVGHLQRNKVRQAVQLFDVIHSVDSVALAMALDERARQAGRICEVLVQVNVAAGPQKFGIAPEALPAMVQSLTVLSGIRVVGLMTIAPQVDHPEVVRPVFRRLRELRDEVARAGGAPALAHLSMGMSEDFEVAVEEGATMVRIGRAIFGPRPHET